MEGVNWQAAPEPKKPRPRKARGDGCLSKRADPFALLRPGDGWRKGEPSERVERLAELVEATDGRAALGGEEHVIDLAVGAGEQEVQAVLRHPGLLALDALVVEGSAAKAMANSFLKVCSYPPATHPPVVHILRSGVHLSHHPSCLYPEWRLGQPSDWCFDQALSRHSDRDSR
jgi:hypothetical protein